MIRIRPGDLLAIKEGDRYYYCLVLSRQIMGGGQLVHAFYFTSESLVPADELLTKNPQGFHRITDFIACNRSGSLARIAARVPTDAFDGVDLFRQDSPSYGRDGTWAIWNRESQVVREPVELTAEEWGYPIFLCSLHHSMCHQIDRRWHPSHDRVC